MLWFYRFYFLLFLRREKLWITCCLESCYSCHGAALFPSLSFRYPSLVGWLIRKCFCKTLLINPTWIFNKIIQLKILKKSMTCFFFLRVSHSHKVNCQRESIIKSIHKSDSTCQWLHWISPAKQIKNQKTNSKIQIPSTTLPPDTSSTSSQNTTQTILSIPPTAPLCPPPTLCLYDFSRGSSTLWSSPPQSVRLFFHLLLGDKYWGIMGFILLDRTKEMQYI